MNATIKQPPLPRRDSNATRGAQIASAIYVFAGLWLNGVPFVFRFTKVTAAVWNDIVVGAVVLTVAWIRFNDVQTMFSLGWVNVLAGAWLLVSALGVSITPATLRLCGTI